MTKLFSFNAPVNRSQTKEIWENATDLRARVVHFTLLSLALKKISKNVRSVWEMKMAGKLPFADII